MHTTNDYDPLPPEPEAPATAPDAAAARARRYLDLWERHVTYLALNGPAPPPRPPRR